jgi:hypothetical protein
MESSYALPPDFWSNVEITTDDVQALHAYLFELETPLPAQELVPAFVEHRLQAESHAQIAKQSAAGKAFLPRDRYVVGDALAFPALGWKRGTVAAVREGTNPSVGSFDVISVAMADDGTERLFAANLADHQLNAQPVMADEGKISESEAVAQAHGPEIATRLEAAFQADPGLVRIAGRWFPRSLLVDVNVGHLNLAEAVLDVSGGEPQPASNLLKDVALPDGVNPKLAEFSLNLALQEDDRFDEVGPAGEVLWCLHRLEPQPVRSVPLWLKYSPVPHERASMSDEMRALELQLDDELSPPEVSESAEPLAALTLSLIYPHLRAGTLPISPRARGLFPTAYQSPRVRFTLVDAKSKQRMPGWVVRQHGYVYGLRDWFKAHELIPGSLVQVRRGEQPGEVVVEAKTQRSSRDWVRTLMIGADGGMVFAMLKQPITAEFNDRMTIYVPDFTLLDPLWEKPKPFEQQVTAVLREMTKVNPQGHVHAQELYAAINLVRRVPPAPLFALLQESPKFQHVGDLHFRIQDEAG